MNLKPRSLDSIHTTQLTVTANSQILKDFQKEQMKMDLSSEMMDDVFDMMVRLRAKRTPIERESDTHRDLVRTPPVAALLPARV